MQEASVPAHIKSDRNQCTPAEKATQSPTITTTLTNPEPATSGLFSQEYTVSDSQRSNARIKPKWPRLNLKRLKAQEDKRISRDWHTSHDDDFNVVIIPNQTKEQPHV